jgi:O-antigen/teichoic acid export membrane protein
MSAEGTQARVVRNTLANTGGTVVAVAITLVLTPFMIGELGVEAYGIWILATTLTFGLGYLSFADLGLEQAAVRYIAEARAEGDDRRMNETWVTAFALLGAVALVLTPPLVLLSGPLVDLFSVPGGMRDEAQVAFAFVMAQLLLELPGRAFAALLEGAQRYGLWQVTRLFQTVLLSGLMVAVLLAGEGIDWLGIATFAGQAATFLFSAVLALAGVRGARFSPRLVSRRTARALATFGGQLFAFRLLSSIYRQMDKTIIGIALSTSAVTTYEIGNKLYTSAALIQSLATSALVPAAAFSRDEPGRLRELLLRGSNYTVALALPFMTAAYIFADPLIRTWIGTGHGDAVTPARLLLLSLVPSFAIVVGQTMLVGLGRVGPMIWMVAGWTATNLGLSLALVGPMGINGVIVATLASTVLLFFPVTWLFLREIDVGWVEWTRDVLVPVVPALAVQVGAGLLLLPIAERTDSLLVVAALCGGTIALAILAWALLGLSRRRRRELVQMIRETAGRGGGEPVADADMAGDLPAPAGVSVRE